MHKLSFVFLIAILAAAATPADAQRRSCEDLKMEIAAKLDAKGVRNYTLTIVSPEEAKGATIVGSCDGGTRRILYRRD